MKQIIGLVLLGLFALSTGEDDKVCGLEVDKRINNKDFVDLIEAQYLYSTNPLRKCFRVEREAFSEKNITLFLTNIDNTSYVIYFLSRKAQGLYDFYNIVNQAGVLGAVIYEPGKFACVASCKGEKKIEIAGCFGGEQYTSELEQKIKELQEKEPEFKKLVKVWDDSCKTKP